MKKKFSPNFVWGFSLMEMMIVLLIITIIMAAAAPIITKRAKRSASSGSVNSSTHGKVRCTVNACHSLDPSLITGTNGNYSFKAPSGVTNFMITIVGGGGGGTGYPAGTPSESLQISNYNDYTKNAGGNGEEVITNMTINTFPINIKVGFGGKKGGNALTSQKYPASASMGGCGGYGGDGAVGYCQALASSLPATTKNFNGISGSNGSDARGGKGGDGEVNQGYTVGVGGVSGGAGGSGIMVQLGSEFSPSLQSQAVYAGAGGGGTSSCVGSTCARGGDGGTFSKTKTVTSYPIIDRETQFGIGGAAQADGTNGYVIIEW